jgi:hypothetical protein
MEVAAEQALLLPVNDNFDKYDVETMTVIIEETFLEF